MLLSLTSFAQFPPTTAIGFITTLCVISFQPDSSVVSFYPKHTVGSYTGTHKLMKKMKQKGLAPEYPHNAIYHPRGADYTSILNDILRDS